MTLSFSRMTLFRSTDTTRPLFASIGLASADGRVRSRPPVIIGAVNMKMTNSSIMTSIRLTTLISALRCIRSRPRRRLILDAPLADQTGDDGCAEALHHQIEPVQPVREDVVAECRRDRDSESRRGCDQSLRDAWGNGRQVGRTLRSDSQERVDHAENGAEKSDERAHR